MISYFVVDNTWIIKSFNLEDIYFYIDNYFSLLEDAHDKSNTHLF